MVHSKQSYAQKNLLGGHPPSLRTGRVKMNRNVMTHLDKQSLAHLQMENTEKRKILTLPLPSLLVPTPFTKGVSRPPSYLKNRCPHERAIFQSIRDTFESLRNVKLFT